MDELDETSSMCWKCDICGSYKKINDIIYYVKIFSRGKFVEVPINLCNIKCLKKLYERSIRAREEIAINKLK